MGWGRVLPCITKTRRMAGRQMSQRVSDPTDMAEYLAGRKLYGDDFSLPEIEKWYEDERDGYAGLISRKEAPYAYEFHSLNRLHGFRFVRDGRFKSALGLGSAYGDEFLPIVR